MKSTLVKRGKFYSVRYFDEQRRRWTHTSLKTSKKAVADQRYGDFLKDCQKTELLGQFRVQPVPLSKLVTDFLEYMESKRSPRYVKLVRSFTRQWLAFFGANTLTTAITVHTIEKYAAQRKKNTCRTKKTQISNATVNRDLSALKHMLHKAERWGSVEVSPGRRVDLLKDDSTVRTDYFTAEQIRLLVGRAENDRNQRRNHFHDWPEFIVLDVNTGLRCQEMLFLEFSDIDWQSGVVHIRNKRHLSFSPKGRKERRVPLNEPAMSALHSMLRKHEATDFVFHQHDGSRWKLMLESFRSLLKRCGLKRVGIHALRHTFGAHLAQRGVDMAVIRDLLGHHSVTLTEKYYAHLAPSSMSRAVQQLEIGNGLKQSVPKTVPTGTSSGNSGPENLENPTPLTDSFQRCYVPEVALLAGVAKLAYAADSKSAGT